MLFWFYVVFPKENKWKYQYQGNYCFILKKLWNRLIYIVFYFIIALCPGQFLFYNNRLNVQQKRKILFSIGLYSFVDNYLCVFFFSVSTFVDNNINMGILNSCKYDYRQLYMYIYVHVHLRLWASRCLL